MNIPTRADLKTLLNWDAPPAVSIYMPIHRIAAQSQEDALRLKNLLQQAQEQLQEKGLRRPEAEKLLEPVRRLERDHLFWTYHSADGLALFAAPGFFRYYRVPHRFAELLCVADTFHIKPLMHLLLHAGRFYLLALSRNAVRLYQGSVSGISPIDLPEGAPANMKEALAGTEIEKSLQHHTVVEGGGPEGMVGVLHGHGEPKDYEKKALEEYFRQIASPLQKLLARERVPLVLAAVAYYHPLFRNIYRHASLIENGVIGSPDEFTEKELHERAWPIVEPHLQQDFAKAVQRYHKLAGSGRTSNDLTIILPAAFGGRIDTLFAAMEAQVWGQYDAETQEVVTHPEKRPDAVDLLNLAVEQTLLHDGEVYVPSQQDIPISNPEVAGSPEHAATSRLAAAIFRW